VYVQALDITSHQMLTFVRQLHNLRTSIHGQELKTISNHAQFKTRSWEAFTPPSNFAIVEGKDCLQEYSYGNKVFPHYFCKHCGVHTHLTGNIPPMGGELVMVRINCLDDVEPKELVDAPIKYFDNLNDVVCYAVIDGALHWTGTDDTSHGRRQGMSSTCDCIVKARL
jgi:hypothetical protein